MTIIKTVFCDSYFSTNTECCWFTLYFMQNNLDFLTTTIDGDEFIHYNKM